MKSILQVIGPPGVGKTTLCHALLTYFSESPSSPLKQKSNSPQLSLLVIDASPDQDLTQQFGATSPEDTIHSLIQRFSDKPFQSNERVDWGFHNLTTTIGEDLDLMTVGPMIDNLSLKTDQAEKMLRYGFNRLLELYPVTIIDGNLEKLLPYLPEGDLKTLAVITPEIWDEKLLSIDPPFLPTPHIVVNQCSEAAMASRIKGTLGESLDKALDAGTIALIGKLPRYGSEKQVNEDLSQAFWNCVLRLDLPLGMAQA